MGLEKQKRMMNKNDLSISKNGDPKFSEGYKSFFGTISGDGR